MLSKLELFTEACATLDKRGVAVRNELCLHTRHQASSCLRCSSICPAGAIRFDNGLVFTAEQCSGCGACTSVCPSGALSSKSPANDEIRALVRKHIAQSQLVVFACENYLAQHPEHRDRAIAVACTSRLDESILVDAVLAGAQSVSLIDAACGDCPQGQLRSLTQKKASVSTSLLERFNLSPSISLVTEIPAPARRLPVTQEELTGFSRRTFLWALKGRGPSLAALALPGMLTVALGKRAENPNARPSLADHPKHVPDRQRSLFASFSQLPSPAASSFESELWGNVTVSDACNGCGACAETCPSGALIAIEKENLWGLFFEASRCTQCGLCVNVCCRESLTLSPIVPLDSLLAQQPRVLQTKTGEEINMLTESMEARMGRLLGGFVTW